MTMQYIPQAESDGCMVAAVAMVTGRSYAEIRALCDASYSGGIHEVIADNILGDLGFAVVRRYRHVPRLKADRDVWPCSPFAPAHIALVHATQGPHAIAIDANGVVFDPWNRERTTLDHPDYSSISWIAGVFQVQP